MPIPEHVSATIWKRIMAFEIDMLLVTISCLTTFCVGLFAAWLGLKVAGYDTPSYSLIDTLLLPFGFLSPIVSLAYFIGFASYRGQTPGKAIMRIKIVSITGENVTLFMIAVRTLGYIFSGMLFGLGFFMALVTRRRRALHDFLANTHVVAI